MARLLTWRKLFIVAVGKLFFNSNNKEVADYVIDKTQLTWRIKLITNEDIEIRKVELDQETQ